jgi:hypothetical protein
MFLFRLLLSRNSLECGLCRVMVVQYTYHMEMKAPRHQSCGWVPARTCRSKVPSIGGLSSEEPGVPLVYRRSGTPPGLRPSIGRAPACPSEATPRRASQAPNASFVAGLIRLQTGTGPTPETPIVACSAYLEAQDDELERQSRSGMGLQLEP